MASTSVHARVAARPNATPRTLVDMVESLAECCTLSVLDQYDSLDWADTMLTYAHKLREQHKSTAGKKKSNAPIDLAEIIKTPARSRTKKVVDADGSDRTKVKQTKASQDKENIVPAAGSADTRKPRAGAAATKRKAAATKAATAAPTRKKRKSEQEMVQIIDESSNVAAERSKPAATSTLPTECSPEKEVGRPEGDGNARETAEQFVAMTPLPSKQKRGLMSQSTKSLGASHIAATPANTSMAQSFAQRLIAGALGSTGHEASSSDPPVATSFKPKVNARKSDEALGEQQANEPSVAIGTKRHMPELPSGTAVTTSKSALETLRSRIDNVSKRTSTAPHLALVHEAPARATLASKNDTTVTMSHSMQPQPSTSSAHEVSRAMTPKHTASEQQTEVFAPAIVSHTHNVVSDEETEIPARFADSSNQTVQPAGAVTPKATSAISDHSEALPNSTICAGSTTPLESPKRPDLKSRLPTASPGKISNLKFVPSKNSKLAGGNGDVAHAQLSTSAAATAVAPSSWTFKIKGLLGIGTSSTSTATATVAPGSTPVATTAQSATIVTVARSPKKAQASQQPLAQQLQPVAVSQAMAPAPKLPSLMRAEALRKQTEQEEERRQRERDARRKQVEAKKDLKETQAKKRVREDAPQIANGKVTEKKTKLVISSAAVSLSAAGPSRQANINRIASTTSKLLSNQPPSGARFGGAPPLAGIVPPPLKRVPTSESLQTLKTPSHGAASASNAAPPSASIRASQTAGARPPPSSSFAFAKKTPKQNGPPSAQPSSTKVSGPKGGVQNSNFTQHNPFQQQHKSALPTPKQKTPIPTNAPTPESVADEDIALPDVQSEYSMSDDEETQRRRAEAPSWTKGRELQDALTAQAAMDPDAIFGRPHAEVSLATLFPTSTRARRPRSSSGNWTVDQVKQWEVEAYNIRMGITQAGSINRGEGSSRTPL